MFPAICAIVLLWSCEKNQTKESISFESDFFESEILCLNAGNDVENGIVQLYFGKTNEVVDLNFTAGLGIIKLFKIDSEVYALTHNRVLKINPEFNSINYQYSISKYDVVKLNENYFYFYSESKNSVTVIDITDGSLIKLLELDFELVDYEFGSSNLYLLSEESLFVVSLDTFEHIENAQLYGVCKNLELIDDFNAYVVSITDSNEVILSVNLNYLGIVGIFHLNGGHTLQEIEVEKGKDFITYITNNTNFYHGQATDLSANFRFINKRFNEVKSFVYTDNLNFFMVEDNLGLEKGKIHQYSFYGPKVGEATVGYNPIQLLDLD